MIKHYKISEVAELLSVNHKTIRKLIRKGTIPAVKVAGVIRIPEDGLNAYLDSQTIKKPMAKKPSAKVKRVGSIKDYFA